MVYYLLEEHKETAFTMLSLLLSHYKKQLWKNNRENMILH